MPLLSRLSDSSLQKFVPYIEATDLIVGENTCDGKKKAYEAYGKIVDNLYVMDLPQMKSQSGRELLKTEYKTFCKTTGRDYRK